MKSEFGALGILAWEYHGRYVDAVMVAGVRMVSRRIFLGFGLAMLFAPYCNAQLSTNLTIHYVNNLAEGNLYEFDSKGLFKKNPFSIDEYQNNSQDKFDLSKKNYSSKEKGADTYNFIDHQLDKQFGSDFTFSIRTPSYGVFDLKNNKDDITQYKDCFSKTMNYTDQGRCNIEILFGKKFHL